MTDDLHLAIQDTHGPLTVVTVSGAIDFHTAPHLRTGGLELIERGHHQLILVLTDVNFCNSAGLSALIGLWRPREPEGPLPWPPLYFAVCHTRSISFSSGLRGGR